MKFASITCILAAMAAAADISNIGISNQGSGTVALKELDTYYADNITATVSTSNYYETLMNKDNLTSLNPLFVRSAGLLGGSDEMIDAVADSLFEYLWE